MKVLRGSGSSAVQLVLWRVRQLAHACTHLYAHVPLHAFDVDYMLGMSTLFGTVCLHATSSAFHVPAGFHAPCK